MIRSTRLSRSVPRVARRALPLLVTVGLLAALWTSAPAADPPRVPATEASRHVGEIAEVCGRVASAAYIASVKGRPTFLNLERPYPDQPFTVVIWGSNRAGFASPPERLFDAKSICVTGRIETYRGKPQIEVTDPGQITITTPAGGGETLSEIERVLTKALLASLGYDVNYGTGEWDQATVDAAVSFQEAAGIAASGDPDPETLRALAEAVGTIPDADRTMIIRLLLFETVRRLE